MKKYNEGYALPFVLVVFLVLSLIATSILTFSLQNLQSQQASIQRTKDQYAAQGEIEKVVARLGNNLSDSILDGYCGDAVEYQLLTVDGDEKSVYLDLAVASGTVRVECRLKLISTSKVAQGNNLYSFTDLSITYESYTVSSIQKVDSNGGGG